MFTLIIKFDNYNLGRRIVSIAFSQEIEKDLKKNSLDALFIGENYIYFWKDEVKLSISKEVRTKLGYCDNYDVFQIDESGNAYLYYSNESIDNVFLITGKCNSNCFMCPTGNAIRRNGENADIQELLNIVKHIPSDAKHFTITGGEPFLMGKELFSLFNALKNKFTNTEYLLLTNGRALSLPEFAAIFHETAPLNMVIGIPLHGHNEELHDRITRTPGGFKQTVTGIKNLLNCKRRVEIRIVVSLLNYKYIYEIVRLIISEFSSINSVKIMGLEMTGNAAINRELIWISYREAFQASKKAIVELINNKTDVALYNFPLCTVDKSFQMLCRKSITDYKVRFADVCDICTLKDACGGVFAGSFILAEKDLNPEVYG